MKHTKEIIALLLLSALTVTLFVGCGGKSNDDSSKSATGKLTGSVATDGSTSMEKVIGALGEAFSEENSDVSFTYNPTGSGSGISAVKEKRCDIGLSSRTLKDDEKASGLSETTLALDGIAIIVNPSNGINDLSVEQISDIYTGKIKNWKEIGGSDKQIVVIGREAGSGTRDGFETVTNTKDKCALRQELTSTGDVLTTVGQNVAAIGYTSLAAVNDKIKSLTVGGVKASEENVQNKSYILQRPFVLVTRNDVKLSTAAQAFFDYATGKDAEELISSAGAIPVK